MSYCGIQQKNDVCASFDREEHMMVCPKPTRPLRPLRWHMSYQAESYESIASLELMEIIFESTPVASSSPFFSGSPPSRVSNPLTHDTRFRDSKVLAGMSPLSSSSEKKVGSVGGNFGDKPVVRIEGFDCIPTLA